MVQPADMLEHADRDEPVVFRRRRQVIVILQFEADPVGNPPPGGAIPRDTQLFLAERAAGAIDAGGLRQIPRPAAPARAHLPPPLPRPAQSLGGDMPFLTQFPLVQAAALGVRVGLTRFLYGHSLSLRLSFG